ncbi:MAG: hypothetical protein A3C30_01625 [Candidatus Levybacteria bacterium RIFCSPHIGHO2_02_FULL_40_18]|nr:MAG: hypothetical protein A2869_01190 [Candidatus Levybacteria bacterium RIFCSPHIGHO2_01_FULL_40_58]OGH26692.1 MAG: hypothetical protein A3C30_01625 [Candidatus Levybacteria bacterium RIFCSPHIGHO2_02_FULL_40_18]OGH31627.1 MAG: hypothetical protein A3E43_01345 [Candidatus Levybacteria bacterium RIFCSPHIGHO2_12_FULL_40_31]OGH40255.1 MAG: hypothetical protein A2894_02360 [Candidatus Levybacteria bacterium RIFCSPLOWO2_01_FULL_40_64]OGH49517.1 MAG: hypothetical protein A3I54_03250 [Candidatus Lev
MKRIISSILVLFVLTLIVAIPVFAVEKNKNVLLPATEMVDHDYFAAGDTVKILGTVNGDAYVAGGTIIVEGKINGDLLTGGGNVTVSGNIQGDIRAAGGNVILNGADIGGNVTVGGGNITIDRLTVIQGSLVAGGGSVQIFAPIGRGVTIGGGSVLIGNSVGGDILAGVGELSLSPEANVDGNLTYWSENEVNIQEGASVSGKIKHETPPRAATKGKDFDKGIATAIAGFALMVKLVDILWLIIVGLALMFFFPNYTTRASDYIRTKFGLALLIGFMALIVTPILGIILFITLFGIPAAITLFIVFLLMFWFGRIFAIYTLGRFVLAKAGNKNAKAWAYIVGIVVYLILTIIPIVNFITDILITLSGVGALLALKKIYYTELKQKKLI